MKPKIVTIFNNKGGVGKTTLAYHLAHAIGELDKKILLVDLDPQCNLTIFCLDSNQIGKIWVPEDPYIDDFAAARSKDGDAKFDSMLACPRTIHFNLKPAEDGTAELPKLPRPITLNGPNVDIIPGRLTLHLFEAKVAERWSGIYQGDPLAIRTATRVRSLVLEYSRIFNYDLVIFDTSPSLGALNRHLLSLADGFIIPCAPDLFSVYGIRNIGNALKTWKKQFESIFHFLSDEKRHAFPQRFVRFMGYTLYNAKRYARVDEELDLATAHMYYAKEIPRTIKESIDKANLLNFPNVIDYSIGGDAIIYSHNTFPSNSQKYHLPMWKLPDCNTLDSEDRQTISGNQRKYRETRKWYIEFAEDFLKRVDCL